MTHNFRSAFTSDFSLDAEIGYFLHLDEKNLSYFSHLIQAWNISWKLFKASIGCFIHGFYPDVFTKIASDTATEILDITSEPIEEED
jgi:hypothetical protein